ncbi:PrsW family intramembrane metalloprotease [Chitinophaga polysaccharea]|uniref:PrsW family intramembrane metalloprotease n=1 Tax=Chitinophaga TaxID=79328 RepID=UPI00145578C4|nr:MULTISPECIES: PrsW family glutamic-type intramembrane protease [Chitinophaga]NLR57169.1 PrsW family intramembrane metalloprotease [Chitinophaga polysaccharea]NLU91707.1 PrsW family intramembrane metalloprotease [Chitinophaga sp. Ak27]
MMLLALAVAPGFAICLFIYLIDKYDREPTSLLIKSFLLGMGCVVFPLVIQGLAAAMGWHENNGTILGTAAFAYGIVGLSEELAKFMVLLLYAYPKKAFNEPLDGIVYAVMIGMGFATLENIAYVAQYGFGTGVARMFLSVPAHATFAILMGYYTGLAKFIPQRSSDLLFRGLLIAIFFHGSFDFFLFLGNNIFLMGASVITLIFAIRLSIRAIRKDARLSKEIHEHGQQHIES